MVDVGFIVRTPPDARVTGVQVSMKLARVDVATLRTNTGVEEASVGRFHSCLRSRVGLGVGANSIAPEEKMTAIFLSNVMFYERRCKDESMAMRPYRDWWIEGRGRR